MKKPSTYIMLVMALVTSLNAFSTPKLNSYPSAVATIFLDFDGHFVSSSVWNNGNPINCAPSGMTDLQITETFNRVAEDYRPFDINITTDSAVFLAAPLTKRIRVIITPSSSWCPGVGGVAYVGSFTWGDDTPAFTFCNMLGPNDPKIVAECCSHESGHTVGLSHQSKYGPDCMTPIETYNTGTGIGEIAWAPIMGNSYYRNMTNWNNGPTPYGCTATQDNLYIISTQNGFSYRADDFGEILDASTYTLPPVNFSQNGIISTNTDKDAFKFTLPQNSTFHFTANPFNVASNGEGANLDIKLSLFNSAGALIRTYDPPNTLSVTVDTNLLAGSYYLLIDGTGNANIGEYGSLGEYSISGNSGILPIHEVSLTGTVSNTKHKLNWNIIADEPLSSIIVESSLDGVNFKTLTSLGARVTQFSYAPYQNSNIYYRLKVTSVIGQSVYSNVLVLRGEEVTDKSFFVSTFVKSDIMVNAADNYQYQISDMNGREIMSGIGLKGINKIIFSGNPDGMYIIQLHNNNLKQTERIIKQ